MGQFLEGGEWEGEGSDGRVMVSEEVLKVEGSPDSYPPLLLCNTGSDVLCAAFILEK